MALVGPGGRLLRRNAFPIVPAGHLGGAVFSLGTADGDVITTVIMPGDGWVGHSVIHCSNAGTGTDTPTVLWRSASAGAGSPLTGPHVDKNGALVDYDVGGGLIDFAADGTMLPISGQPEGSQIFLRVTFGGGTHTSGGSWECSLFLLL